MEGEQEARAEVYRYRCPLYTDGYPSFKPVDTVKQADGRYRKVYEKTPATAYRRLLESPEVSEESKAELMRRKGEQNPVVLNTQIPEAVERLLKLNREKARMKQTSGQEWEQAETV